MSTQIDIIGLGWNFGTALAESILSAIVTLTNDPINKPIKRVDGEGWSAYWAGTVLRIDIKEGEFVG